jgi:hypothetical protein
VGKPAKRKAKTVTTACFALPGTFFTFRKYIDEASEAAIEKPAALWKSYIKACGLWVCYEVPAGIKN